MRRIGFIGIGAIGFPMAQRLLQEGFDVIACDRSDDALARFRAAGGRTTGQPRDCSGEDAVVFMVADDRQLSDCVHGPDGLLAGPCAPRSSLCIVMSTVQPDSVGALAQAVGPHGIGVVDVPVSGGPLAAAEGRLTLMAGGDDADLDRAQPVLAALGRAVHRCGPLGTGALTKIVNNLVGVTTLMLLAEGLQLARAHGMDLDRLSAVMEASSGRNAGSADWQRTQAVFEEFSSDLPRVASFLRINAKDMQLALTLGERAGIAMPILRAALQATAAMSAQEMYDRMRSFLQPGPPAA
jgi:3-hydroxyisobutyrate dehydrogenase-like beta-hydroxyacid dehydrogenase